MPHVNWQSVFESCPTSFTTFAVDKGYEKVYMSEGLQVLLVEDAKHVDSALAKLRASMTVSAAREAADNLRARMICWSSPKLCIKKMALSTPSVPQLYMAIHSLIHIEHNVGEKSAGSVVNLCVGVVSTNVLASKTHDGMTMPLDR